MSYSFKPAEPVAANIREVGKEQLDKALASLGTIQDEPDAAIHDVRKRLKKLRALVRICRHELGEEYYKERNICFRDAGRRLSNLRNLSSMQSTLQLMHERYHEGLKANAFKGIAKQLQQEKEEEVKRHITVGDVGSALREVLEAEAAELPNWPLENEHFYQIVPAIQKVYKRGYKAFHKAVKKPDAVNKHEWRKRVKYLGYHIRLLRPLWPTMWKSYAKEWHHLGQILGDDHDLAVLQHTIGTEAFIQEEETACRLLEGLTINESRELEEKAFITGHRLFAEEPAAFGKRIKNILKTAGSQVLP